LRGHVSFLAYEFKNISIGNIYDIVYFNLYYK